MGDELLSTGELGRRIGFSQSGVRKLIAAGVIPPGTTIVGSGRFVWRESDLPAIEAALRSRTRRGRRLAERAAA